MLCDVCKQSLEGMNDPIVTPHLRAVQQGEHRSRGTLFDIEKHVFGHHRTRDSLVQSIKQQCLLSVKFKDHEHNLTRADDDFLTSFNLFVYEKEKRIFVNLMWRGTRAGTLSILLPLESMQEKADLILELNDNTDGQHSRRLIDGWDKNCLAKHSRCTRTGDSAFLPTKILEFEDGSNPTTCRLVLREEIYSNSRYTALSYRWGTAGKPGKLCLLQSTFDTIRSGLPLGSLSKTYVDAIHVTARLGIRYIWIDALCIIQDSPKDWRVEAATMQAVYRNSYLTISAVAGAHDDSGLFYSRDPAKVQPTVVNIAYTSYDKPKTFVCSDETQAVEASFRLGNVTRKRGWCPQERLLPCRVLHFGSQQVFWECHEQHASETMPWSMSYGHWDRDLPRKRLWKLSIGETLFLDPEDPYTTLFLEWYAMISIYSNCQLTHASDKLVAISGLANDMRSALNTRRPHTHHTYIADLWAEDLRFGLCWSLDGFGSRSAVYRAPSWSPMSLDGSIHWNGSPKRDEFTWHVTNANCTAATRYINDLDTGEVTSA
ncbi:heterokaryon incompatibility protein-domain-containing protein [Alternaria rosae]|uniref:heterokaryon incompatibility protein-domain-containing protein n=1 Tax=Alternaria rosae TaxID=1187941 RepID=UPI001E8EEC60|nr:heterokaryon incompatibility protein-domain-containing protein [Alternaria rosae]KAH6878354.1 heterokaryon incompatibility protein-domain-containing protein [Alternaria rosae]